MKEKKIGPAPKAMWAYSYQIDPPQPEGRFKAIKTLLDLEHHDARKRDQTWRGKLVREKEVTHILVVSDSPDQGREVNRRLEAELKAVEASFSISAPMAVEGPTVDAPGGEGITRKE